jgi:hypothetical protein
MEKKYLVVFVFAILFSISMAFLINNVMASITEDSESEKTAELEYAIGQQEMVLAKAGQALSKGVNEEAFNEMKELLNQIERNGQEIAEKARQIGSHNGKGRGHGPPIVNPGY